MDCEAEDDCDTLGTIETANMEVECLGMQQFQLTASTASTASADGPGEVSADKEDEHPKISSSINHKTFCFICGKPQSKFTRHLRVLF